MRVLWVCNIMLPVIAEALHREASNKEGWLSGLLSQVVDREDTDMTLAVAFPVPAGEEIPQSFVVRVQGEHPACVAEATSATEAASAPEGGGGYLVRCYGFHEDTVHPDRYQPELEEELRKITEDYDPDVIHCFGTEYPHTLAVCRVYPHPERILLGIQGICSLCAEAYFADLPERVTRKPAQPAGEIRPQRCDGERSHWSGGKYHRQDGMGPGGDHRVESRSTVLSYE